MHRLMPFSRTTSRARPAALAALLACALVVVVALATAGLAAAAGTATIGATTASKDGSVSGTGSNVTPGYPAASPAPAATTAPSTAPGAGTATQAVPPAGTTTSAGATALPSAADIDAYLAGKGSPLAGQGAAFLTSGGRWQVDPRLVVAISGAESSFGTILCGPFNAWGYGCPNNPYGWTSWAQAIDSVAQGLRTNYVAQGRVSVALIGAKYAPVHAANDPTGLNNAWVTNVSRFLVELGGDPQDIDLAGPGSPALPVGAPLSGLGGVVAGATPAAAYDFSASDTPPSAVAGVTADGTAPVDAQLVAASGSPAHLQIQVENTGSSTWNPGEVLLERTDGDGHLASAPYAALVAPVAPSATGSFGVDLAVAGTSDVTVDTTWRLVGPTGPFGAEVDRRVQVRLDTVAYAVENISAPGSLPAGGTAVVVVKLRNAGATPWLRDGDAPVRLVVTYANGPDLSTARWLRRDIPGAVLQRRVDPGEVGSVAFPVHVSGGGTQSAHLVIHAFAGADPATGADIPLDIGSTIGQ